MAKRGYRVYSGVLSKEGGEKLREKLSEEKVEGVIIPLLFDITKEEQIEQVFRQLEVELKDSGLHMLINNAGIGFNAPLELLPFKDFRFLIDVNLLGHVRVTQKFLPLIRKVGAGARIVNIASLAGRISSQGFTAYSASKFAIEAVTDALRRELRHLRIAVSAIEPSFAKTNILESGESYINRVWDQTSEELRSVYQTYKARSENGIKEARKQADDPNVVVTAIIHACTSPTPNTRYLVCKGAKFFAFLAWILPDHVMDHFLEVSLQKAEQP